MRIGKIQIQDRAKISKALNRNRVVIYIVVAIFIVIDVDLFSSHPRFLITDASFWKGITLVFQLLFAASLIKWDYTKKTIIDILSNGMIVKGHLKFSERLESNNSISYLHLFEYTVSGKTYDIDYKNKSKHVNTHYIIYRFDHPQKAIVFENLKSSVKHLIEAHR